MAMLNNQRVLVEIIRWLDQGSPTLDVITMVNQQSAGHPAIAQDSNSEWVMPRIESFLQAPGSLGPSNHCHDVVNFPSPWVPRNPSLIQTSQQKNTGKWAIQPTEMASFSPFLTLFTNLEGKFQDPRPPTSHRQAAHPLRSMLRRRGRASHPGHPANSSLKI